MCVYDSVSDQTLKKLFPGLRITKINETPSLQVTWVVVVVVVIAVVVVVVGVIVLANVLL